jgi:hypothetical protein
MALMGEANAQIENISDLNIPCSNYFQFATHAITPDQKPILLMKRFIELSST